ncbi:MAG: DUF1634 domain-containing protein [Clostridia bacterium]|nr:DUF1634 domain-containing protein [Clostridia bacterium]
MEEITVIPQPEPQKKDPNEVGFWTYFGLVVLFLTPVAGLIASIVFSFAPKNRNVKNFARAAMTLWIVEILVFAIALGSAVLFLRGITDAIADAVAEYLTDPEVLASLGPFGEILSQIPEEDLRVLLEEYQKSGITGVMKRLTSGEFDDLISQFENGEFGDPNDIVDQFEQNGGSLTDILDPSPTADPVTP